MSTCLTLRHTLNSICCSTVLSSAMVRTGSGAVKSWTEIARAVFDAANGNSDKVVPVGIVDYYASAEGSIAPRPVHSALDLSKLEQLDSICLIGRKSCGSILKPFDSLRSRHVFCGR